ncbi:RHS repeat-associated core domain-containing protein, partial [Fulvivirga kasyanovii]
VLETSDYYPFGLTFNSYQRVTAKENRYLYNGKERINELDLNWYDYGARMYMPEIGRWNGVDPLADDYTPISVYAYVANNPLSLVDPNGMEIIFTNEESEKQFNRIYASADDKTKAKLDQLRSSDVKYNINVSRELAQEGGSTLYNFNSEQLDINVNPAGYENDVIAMLGDELTHASQFENGEIGFVESGGESAVVGYDIQDEVDSKLGAMNAVEAVNENEGADLELTGTTKRFADAYNEASDEGKTEASEKFFKKDKVGKLYNKEFSSKKMGEQSNIKNEISNYINNGYNISDYIYRENGNTIRKNN